MGGGLGDTMEQLMHDGMCMVFEKPGFGMYVHLK